MSEKTIGNPVAHVRFSNGGVTDTVLVYFLRAKPHVMYERVSEGVKMRMR